MTLISRTTNSLSIVIEQKAFNLSSLLLTNLTLTSVIFIFFASLKSLPSIATGDNAFATNFFFKFVLVLPGYLFIPALDDTKHG